MKRNVSVVRFKFRCNIFLVCKCVGTSPGPVASGIPCIKGIKSVKIWGLGYRKGGGGCGVRLGIFLFSQDWFLCSVFRGGTENWLPMALTSQAPIFICTDVFIFIYALFYYPPVSLQSVRGHSAIVFDGHY